MKTITCFLLPLLFILVASCNRATMNIIPAGLTVPVDKIAGVVFPIENVEAVITRTPYKITAKCMICPANTMINIQYDLDGQELKRLQIDDHGRHIDEYSFQAILLYNKGKEKVVTLRNYVSMCGSIDIYHHNSQMGYREYDFLKHFAFELLNELRQQPNANNIQMIRYLPISKN